MDRYENHSKVNSKIVTTALLLGVGGVSYFAGYKTAQPAMNTVPEVDDVANLMSNAPDAEDVMNMNRAVGHET